MSNNFDDVLGSISSLKNRTSTVYIHCSKLNSLIRDVVSIPDSLSDNVKERLRNSKSEIHLKAFISMNSLIIHLHDLAFQCSKDMCAHFLLSTSIKKVKNEVIEIRKGISKAFDDIGNQSVSNSFKVDNEEMDSQDYVDMKRILLVLIEIKKRNREDTKEKISARFESLAQIGISEEMNSNETITIPDLPQNFRLLLSHKDVVCGGKIGKGLTGNVFKGVLASSNEEVAVKVIHNEKLTPIEQESFRREVFVLSVLNHPSLLKFCGYTEDPPYYIITEYMPNGDLFNRLHSKPNIITPTMRSIIALDVARGVEYLHSKSIIHRDLKSLNILLDKDFRAKICDFGMVRTKELKRRMTGLIGTPSWMAPEVLLSYHNYDEKVDVYSFAIILWELLTGSPPFKNTSPSELCNFVAERGGRLPIPENTPKKLSNLIQKCWDQDPSHRPSMDKVVQMLLEKSYHYPGTDEELFVKVAGIQQQKKSFQIPIQLSTPNFNFISTEVIINQLKAGRFIPNHFKALESIDTRKELLSMGFSTHLSVILDNKGNQSHDILSRLTKCNYPEIFNVDLLRSIAGYAGSGYLISEALEALFHAIELRFDFLSSSSSFVILVLMFLCEDLSENEAEKLLITSHSLLKKNDSLPDGLAGLLLRYRNRYSHIISYDSLVCFVIKNNNQKESLKNFDILLNEPNPGYSIIQTYSEGEEHCENDDLFINFLLLNIENSFCESLLYRISSFRRFFTVISILLPLNIELSKLGPLYLSMMKSEDSWSLISNTSQFYYVVSYLLQQKEFEIIRSVLKSIKIVESFVRDSPICSTLVELIRIEKDSTKLVHLMASVYSVSSSYFSKEFILIVPVLYGFLLGSNTSLRLPSFLCLCVFSHYDDKIVNSDLLPPAAFYVNSESIIIQKEASLILEKHIDDDGVDYPRVVKVFIEHYSTMDIYTEKAVKAFAHSSKRSSIDNESRKRMSHIYSLIPTGETKL